MVGWTGDSLEYEADPRHAEKFVRELSLDGSRTLGTLGVGATSAQYEEDMPLDQNLHSAYRAIAARSHYLASDRRDMQFRVNEGCSWLAKPEELAMARLKRLVRFVESKQRIVVRYPWQKTQRLETYSDTDWAGCIRFRGLRPAWRTSDQIMVIHQC